MNAHNHSHFDEEIKWPSGIKKTKQREEIFKILAKAEKPLSAIDIYDELRAANPTYSISTVYRCMAAFEEYGVVSKSTLMSEDNAVFELNVGPHKHYAICLGCHQLVPLKSCPFENVVINTDDSFTVTDHKLEIYGYCKNCKEED